METKSKKNSKRANTFDDDRKEYEQHDGGGARGAFGGAIHISRGESLGRMSHSLCSGAARRACKRPSYTRARYVVADSVRTRARLRPVCIYKLSLSLARARARPLPRVRTGVL